MLADLLDAYSAALERAGLIRHPVRPGPDRGFVRRVLVDAGYGDRDELLAYFSWAKFPPATFGISVPEWDGDQQALELFEYHPSPLSVSEAVLHGRDYRSIWASWLAEDGVGPRGMIDEEQQPEYGGDETLDPMAWLPVLMGVDSSDVVVVDTSRHPVHGGAVWCLEKHGYFRAFDSLADAIEAATYCVEAGIWSIEDDGYTIGWPERVNAPSPSDLDHPPPLPA